VFSGLIEGKGCSRQASMVSGGWEGGDVVAGKRVGDSVRCTVNRWVVKE